MKHSLSLILAYTSLAVLPASAVDITYDNGITNTSSASGPNWVGFTQMFVNIVEDYGGSPAGPSGGSAATQIGFDLFDPGGGNMDITLLSWTFGPMTLYQGAGTATLSPGDATPGAEDYRYDGIDTNLTFYYDGDEWASGYLTRFIVEVPHRFTADATGSGTAVITSNTAAGQAFFDELMTYSGGTGQLDFTADTFFSVSATDPGTFGSTGSITIVPEPATWAAMLGLASLLVVALRRKK